MTEKFLLAAAITFVLHLFLGIPAPTARRVMIEPKLQTIPSQLSGLPNLQFQQN
jgi:hypothetical protein